jgi:N-acetylmuramoyl-L-alanine amidase
MAFTFLFSGLFLFNAFNSYPFSVKVPFLGTDSIPRKWIEKPLNYSAERTRLSLAYLKDRYGIERSVPIIDPQMIVLHFTNGGTAGSIYNYFNAATIESARSFNKNASDLNVSSHYLVDRDGTVYRLMPDTLFARHIIGLNHCAIGIENIGSAEQPLTDQQVKANIALVRDICSRYPIRYLIGHSEYGVFRRSALWKERDPAYFTSKGDPGIGFMEKVRKGLSDLPLLSKPE